MLLLLATCNDSTLKLTSAALLGLHLEGAVNLFPELLAGVFLTAFPSFSVQRLARVNATEDHGTPKDG
jgi:hypothetical protein